MTPHPSDVIKAYLKRTQFTIPQLANRAGISRSLLNRICLGERRVTPATALKLEKVLGVKAAEWLAIQAAWDIAQERGNDCVRNRSAQA